jgi:hypothetical protein
MRYRYVPALVMIWLTANSIWSPIAALAREEGSSDIIEGLLSSFSLPLQDLFIKKHESEWRNLLDGVTVGFAFNSHSTAPRPGPAQVAKARASVAPMGATVSASLRYNPLSYWSFSTTLYNYLDENQQASWNPDFTYSFGYNDWHPYTLSLVYANYGRQPLQSRAEARAEIHPFRGGDLVTGMEIPPAQFC